LLNNDKETTCGPNQSLTSSFHKAYVPCCALVHVSISVSSVQLKQCHKIRSLPDSYLSLISIIWRLYQQPLQVGKIFLFFFLKIILLLWFPEQFSHSSDGL